jgi:hypothetical protein
VRKELLAVEWYPVVVEHEVGSVVTVEDRGSVVLPEGDLDRISTEVRAEIAAGETLFTGHPASLPSHGN